MTKRDYYEILGVSKDAGPEELKKAYRQMAMKLHPDRNPGDRAAEDKFKEAAEAYEILNDSEKRALYDRYGHDGIRSGGRGGFEGGDFDLSDALRTFMEGFGGFGDFFGSARTHSGPERGNDIQVRILITLEEAAQGVEKKIKLKRQVLCDACGGSGSKSASGLQTCSVCRGSGQVRQVSRSFLGQFVNIAPCRNCGGAGQIVKDPCAACGGAGRRRAETAVTIRIPAGAATGNYITIRGEGDAGPRGGTDGDLYAVIEEKAHDRFERHGDDILCGLKIGVHQAVLGDEVEVPTLTGKAKLFVEAGTPPGKILRMKGKGIPHLHGSGTGDQLVRIDVWIPQKISRSTRELFLKIAEQKEMSPES
jgi:molecular chaperone DnaJ